MLWAALCITGAMLAAISGASSHSPQPRLKISQFLLAVTIVLGD
jgi:hypothetical protein